MIGIEITEHETRIANCETALFKTGHRLEAKENVEKEKYKKNRTSESAFTACATGFSLLETVTDAAEKAAEVAAILLSTARSSFDELQNARKSGQSLCGMVKSISWGRFDSYPNIRGKMTASLGRSKMNFGNSNFSSRGFLREKHETNNSITHNPQRKDAIRANN